TANVRFDRDWGHFQAAGVVREIKRVDTVADNFDLGGRATGAGLSLTSGLNFGKNDVGKFSFVYGHGIQNYMNDAPVDVGIALTHSSNPLTPTKGKALPMWAAMAISIILGTSASAARSATRFSISRILTGRRRMLSAAVTTPRAICCFTRSTTS